MPPIVIPYSPREAFIPFHDRTEDEAVLICHRRAGKTIAICNDAQKRCLKNTRVDPPPRYAWVFPTRVRAKDIAWERLKHYSASIPGSRPIESELAIEYAQNKGRVTLYGADNSRGVGLWLDGAYYDEADEIQKKTIVDLSPTLIDYHGFVVYAGYLTGRHNLFKRYTEALADPKIFKMFLRASESRIYTDEDLAKQRKTMGEAAYLMQWELDVNASIANAIYGKQMDDMRREGRICRVPVDATVPLDFFFDIGHSLTGDDWSVWAIQLQGRDILVHEYYARTGELPAHYAGKVREIADRLGCNVGTVYLPHDGSRKDRQGRSAEDDLRDAGIKRIKIVIRTPNLWDGINTLRALMPRMYVNQAGCSEPWQLGELEMPSGIDCLDYYAKKEDATTGMILEVPIHNQYSHGADALRTFAEAFAQAGGLLEGTSEFARSGARHDIRVSREPVDTVRRNRITVSR